uniref:Uncharacterized protein n=1 Tax=Chelonoidis abingdonii TaxID=106734 RepID=A0A8C0H337_CHEAB
MSPRQQGKATHSSAGVKAYNLIPSRRRRSSSSPAPPRQGGLCQPWCPGCKGRKPTLCNTKSRTPSGKSSSSLHAFCLVFVCSEVT